MCIAMHARLVHLRMRMRMCMSMCMCMRMCMSMRMCMRMCMRVCMCMCMRICMCMCIRMCTHICTRLSAAARLASRFAVAFSFCVVGEPSQPSPAAVAASTPPYTPPYAHPSPSGGASLPRLRTMISSPFFLSCRSTSMSSKRRTHACSHDAPRTERASCKTRDGRPFGRLSPLTRMRPPPTSITTRFNAVTSDCMHRSRSSGVPRPSRLSSLAAIRSY